MDRWGLATAVNVADKFTLECKGGYFPTEMASFESASPQEMQSTWKNMCGFSCARRASPCAHVIASENTVCYSGQNDKPEKLLHKPEPYSMPRRRKVLFESDKNFRLPEFGGNSKL